MCLITQGGHVYAENLLCVLHVCRNKTAQKNQAQLEHKAIRSELVGLDKKKVLHDDELINLVIYNDPLPSTSFACTSRSPCCVETRVVAADAVSYIRSPIAYTMVSHPHTPIYHIAKVKPYYNTRNTFLFNATVDTSAVVAVIGKGVLGRKCSQFELSLLSRHLKPHLMRFFFKNTIILHPKYVK
jgi:hypothetical protein